MKSNGIFFLVTLIAIFATYVSLGRRQYKNPRPTINRQGEWALDEECVDPTHPCECRC